MCTELKDLVGRKITAIYLNSEYLRFDTSDGISYTYRVSGDCCSHSYFYDFYGVKNLLENGRIKEVKTVELHPTDLLVNRDRYEDTIQVYGYQITTESENYGDVTSVFSFRNSSNGYYGGSIDLCGENREGLPKIENDVLEVKE